MGITVTAIFSCVSQLFRKTDHMIRICRLSATSQYILLLKDVRFEDL